MNKVARRKVIFLSLCGLSIFALPVLAQPAPQPDPIAVMVKQLDLEKYKATIKALTRFGDRRQGTDRNRAAIDWIEAQLKSYGCTNTERLQYQFGAEPPHRVAVLSQDSNVPQFTPGGGRSRGFRRPTGVNYDPMAQPDPEIRALDAQPATPGLREEVWCTKIGTAHPGEMYIVAAHMDGIGFGEAANDNGSGTALVMELARIFSAPGVPRPTSTSNSRRIPNSPAHRGSWRSRCNRPMKNTQATIRPPSAAT
jgi:hypothetical protein